MFRSPDHTTLRGSSYHRCRFLPQQGPSLRAATSSVIVACGAHAAGVYPAWIAHPIAPVLPTRHRQPRFLLHRLEPSRWCQLLLLPRLRLFCHSRGRRDSCALPRILRSHTRAGRLSLELISRRRRPKRQQYRQERNECDCCESALRRGAPHTGMGRCNHLWMPSPERPAEGRPVFQTTIAAAIHFFVTNRFRAASCLRS